MHQVQQEGDSNDTAMSEEGKATSSFAPSGVCGKELMSDLDVEEPVGSECEAMGETLVWRLKTPISGTPTLTDENT